VSQRTGSAARQTIKTCMQAISTHAELMLTESRECGAPAAQVSHTAASHWAAQVSHTAASHWAAPVAARE
jgi:hypothetical protein